MTAAKSILILEDEPLIAMMLEDFLDALGHSVAATADSVASAQDAIATTTVDAAILDLNLRGGETSAPIADALAERGIPFLFATGGSGDGIPDRHAGRPTVGKPFTMDAIEQALSGL